MTSEASVTFVIPCLDEADTLPAVLARIRETVDGPFRDRDVEVLVVDNGSVDDSARIALQAGVTVVECPIRGYGAALRHGIEHARGEIAVFADADGTYDFAEAPELVARLEEGFDLVLGSRLKGTIHPGAMPTLHRRLGTPLLTAVLNLLHAPRGQRISDCNSGFRCLRRAAFAGWGVASTGMEFASEMLVKAYAAGARVGEVPVSLRADPRHRTPHLKRWRDGMRHLLEILAASPTFFFRTGSGLWLVSWAALALGSLRGPLPVGPVNLFGLHTMMFALLGSLIGLNLFGLGLLLCAGRGAPAGRMAALIELDEGGLFWGTVAFAAVSFGCFVPIFVSWARAGYRFLALEKQTLLLVAMGANGVFFLSHLIAAHMLKRR